MASQQYRPGDVVPFRFDPGIIVGSYFVSLVGATTTVELLHRRRKGKGWISWLQQLAVSVSFGLVAIWCMHFIGNRAIILGDGSKDLQLYYNPGFTALSAILPIVFLFCGLATVEIRQPGQRFFWPALVVAGIVAGLAITGMHYIGNFGISNYRLHFPAGYIVGAAAIAVCASISALALFFYFKERWINSLPRRMACACLLAGAVSGMHWVASVGTTYTLIGNSNHNGAQGNINLIVAIVISLLSSIICFAFALLTQQRKRQLADRAQHIVLASATFDREGRVLVTEEGLLPCQKITKQYNQRTFNDEFNIAHPVFHWLYRVTFNWSSVSELVPAMRQHLQMVGVVNQPTHSITPGSTGDSWDQDGGAEDHSILFREHFCIAAAELADDLNVPLTDMGILFNQIMMTGTLATEFQPRRKTLPPPKDSETDVESGIISPAMLGRGQLLFLARQADKQEAQRLVSDGFRFAHIHQVGEIIARSLQVPQTELVTTFGRLQKYRGPGGDATKASSYLACFALRASVKASNGGWDVLVPAGSPSQLPMVPLSQAPIQPWQQKIVTRLDGLSVNQCLSFLNNTSSEANNPDEKEWLETLLDQISALAVEVPEQFFGHALFCSNPVKASGIGGTDGSTVQVYAFCIIPDVHGASVKSTNKVTYVPLSFFHCSQRVYKRSPDHAILAREIHREFGAILSNPQFACNSTDTSRAAHSRKGSIDKGSSFTDLFQISSLSPHNSKRHSLFSLSFRPRSRSEIKPEDSSDRGLVDGAAPRLSDARKPSLPPPRTFGGIMVSSDTTVEVHAKEDFGAAHGPIEMADLGVRAEAGQGATEEPTYVDELYRMASLRWQRP